MHAPAQSSTTTAATALSTPRVALPDLSGDVEELRQLAAASRADVRPALVPTPTATPTTTPPPAPLPPPGRPPIVGTFPPVEGCAAVVPTTPPPNGLLSDDELCSIAGDHRLRADAAATYTAMDAAFTAAFGAPLALTDSYRSYDSQVRLYGQKPGLAARPGTSNHGWGIAVDVFGGVDSYGSAEHAWLVEHGRTYGWINPEWARAGGSRPEPWHWEFDASLLH